MLTGFAKDCNFLSKCIEVVSIIVGIYKSTLDFMIKIKIVSFWRQIAYPSRFFSPKTLFHFFLFTTSSTKEGSERIVA